MTTAGRIPPGKGRWPDREALIPRARATKRDVPRSARRGRAVVRHLLVVHRKSTALSVDAPGGEAYDRGARGKRTQLLRGAVQLRRLGIRTTPSGGVRPDTPRRGCRFIHE